MSVRMLDAATAAEATHVHKTQLNLKQINRRFRRQPPVKLLRWGLDTFAPDIVLGTGFGPSGIVLMHMVSQIRPQTTIFYLDTDLLFPETYALRDELARQLGIRFTRVHCHLSLEEQAADYGPELWQHQPDACCYLRKVVPLRRFLADKRAWITGIRRDQSPSRANTALVEWNTSNRVTKINALAYWRQEQVWDYIRAHDLPFNPLHEKGYPSIGCLPCTRPVSKGEDRRAGRWSGHAKLECGIHIENGRVRRK